MGNALTKSEDLYFNPQNAQKLDIGAGEMTQPLNINSNLKTIDDANVTWEEYRTEKLSWFVLFVNKKFKGEITSFKNL